MTVPQNAHVPFHIIRLTIHRKTAASITVQIMERIAPVFARLRGQPGEWRVAVTAAIATKGEKGIIQQVATQRTARSFPTMPAGAEIDSFIVCISWRSPNLAGGSYGFAMLMSIRGS